MASEAGICNIALGRIGVSKTIDALTDNTAEARACRVVYEQARDLLLTLAPWPFATRRANLAELAVDRNGWDYVYALPGDLLVARELYAGQRNVSRSGLVKWRIEGDDTSGRVLMCDLEATSDDPVELIYTAKITATGRFPPAFSEALEWKLAEELARALAVKDPTADRCAQRFEAALQRAVALLANEADLDEPPESEFITVRGGTT